MTVKSGKVNIVAAVLSPLNIDLTTVDLVLGDWSVDVDPNGLLNLLEKDVDSICFDSQYDGAIPLQDEASMKSEDGEEYSGGDKEDVINIELMVQDLDDSTNALLLAQVLDLNGKERVAYYFDPASGRIKKLAGVKMSRNFDHTGGKKEVWTISGTWSGTIATDFQTNTLPLT